MLNTADFYNILLKNKIDFFTGVPDSLLANFCAYITDNTTKEKNITTVNEGAAIALGAGYYLATKKIPLIYMQNSGMGNMINPLLSLADVDVYSIPMLIMIGWRGEPGLKDEPQHKKQGEVTIDLLSAMKIPYKILSNNIKQAQIDIEEAVKVMQLENRPYALVVKKNTFDKYKLQSEIKTSFDFSREEAIKFIVNNLNDKDIVVSTTGKTSRELFEYREELKQEHKNDFLTVGSMGHANHIALGIAMQKPNAQVFCFDGDGAVLMHMGSMGIIGDIAPNNFKHIIFNNGAHDSVGGQPTIGFTTDFCTIAKSCNYKNIFTAKTKNEIIDTIIKLKKSEGPSLLEIKVNKGARKDLGRPTKTPIENKNDLMNLLESL